MREETHKEPYHEFDRSDSLLSYLLKPIRQIFCKHMYQKITIKNNLNVLNKGSVSLSCIDTCIKCKKVKKYGLIVSEERYKEMKLLGKKIE